MTASTVVLVPMALIVDRPCLLETPSLHAWAALIGIATLSTALAYVLYFRILATAGATNVLLVTFLIPVSSIFLGAKVLGEKLSADDLLGLMLIGTGLAAIDGRPFNLLKRSERAIEPWRLLYHALCSAVRSRVLPERRQISRAHRRPPG